MSKRALFILNGMNADMFSTTTWEHQAKLLSKLLPAWSESSMDDSTVSGSGWPNSAHMQVPRGGNEKDKHTEAGSLTSLYNLLSKQGNHYRGSQIWPSLDIVSISVHTNTGKKITNNKETIMEEELFFQQRVEATAKMVPSPLLWQSNSHPRNWKREERPPHTY